jgi:hypothetical protein
MAAPLFCLRRAADSTERGGAAEKFAGKMFPGDRIFLFKGEYLSIRKRKPTV